jgi:TonB family protein
MALTSDLVSSTIVARSREPEGLRKMMMVSSVAHVAVIAALVTTSWILGPHQREEETLMEISLAGAVGPQSGGLTSLSGRAVQKVEPAPELPKPVQARPPAPTKPDMVENLTKTPPKPTPAVQKPSTATKPAPPTTGPELRSGSSRVDTGSTSNEGGLSTGGGGTGGQTTNVNFCDPEYLGQMVALIHRNWRQAQAVTGKPIVRFVILRDGTLSEITLRQPSGYPGLDLEAMRAVTLTRAIPPLPACYPHPHYAMNLTFEYIR